MNNNLRVARITQSHLSDAFRVIYPDGHVSELMPLKEAESKVVQSRKQYLTACIQFGLMGITNLPGI